METAATARQSLSSLTSPTLAEEASAAAKALRGVDRKRIVHGVETFKTSARFRKTN